MTDDVCDVGLLDESSLLSEGELAGLGESISVSSSLSRPFIDVESGVVGRLVMAAAGVSSKVVWRDQPFI